MVSGMLALLVATSAIVGPGDGPDKSPQRYRLDFKLSQTVDLTSAGMGQMASDVSSTSWVTLTVSDTTGGSLAHVVVDSITVTANGQLGNFFTQAMADSLSGEFIHAFIVDGKPEGAPKPSVEDNPVMQMVVPVVTALYPGVGDRASGVESWSDTTRHDVANENGTQNTSQIVDWVVDSRDGTTVSVTGTGNGTLNSDMGGQQTSGIITSTVKVTSPIGGPASSAELSSVQSLTLLNPAIPEPVPLKIETTATMVAVP